MLGGVAGLSGYVWAGIAGDMGRDLRGSGVRLHPNRPPKDGVGKNSICAAVRRYVAWIAGLRICWIRS